MSAADLHRALPESSFQAQVVELADRAGWWSWHDNDPRRNKAGLPDLILVKPPRVLFVELKREKGRFNGSAQKIVLEMLGRCPGVETYLWRPSAFDDIVKILTRRP